MSRKKIFFVGVVIGIIYLSLFLGGIVFSQEPGLSQKNNDPTVVRWAFLSAAISAGLSALAAGIAVGYVGASAVGAMGEKPEISGRALIYVGLAEGIAIYGLIIAIMILGKV
ncbi:MAG: ATP synthase subunit C [Candidatus Omnitrophica bacterium]|nr:ATP synthase subunit C [Candidatus Omnitrophota bacterium]MCM8826335.1 ATP synthase subunit C [Candidatus Omnitrophota bacterium]